MNIRKLKIKNRKGFLASTLVDFLAYVLFVLVVIIFYIVFALNKPTGQIDPITSEYSDLDVNLNLAGFLNTQVTVDNKEMTMADMISIIDLDDHTKDMRIQLFQDTATSYFEGFYPYPIKDWGKGFNQRPYPWWIAVYDADEKIEALAWLEYFNLLFDSGYIQGEYKMHHRDTMYGCNPDYQPLNIQEIPKVNGGYVKVVLCVNPLYTRLLRQ